MAAAAPAQAASGDEPTLAFVGACKFPGNSCNKVGKGYAFGFDVTNTSNKTIYLCTPTISNISDPDPNLAGLAPVPLPGGCVEVPAGGSGRLIIYVAGGENSGNAVFTATLTIPWGHTCPCTDDHSGHLPVVAQVNVASTPPGGLCDCLAPWIPE